MSDTLTATVPTRWKPLERVLARWLRLRLRKVVAFCVLLGCVGIEGKEVRAGAIQLFGFGARGVAMGGAVASSSEGYESVYYNPAALITASELSFNMGYQGGAFDLQINQESWDIQNASALTVGFGLPLPFGGALKERIALGLGFVIPQSSVLVADLPRPGEPAFTLLETRAQAVAIQAGIGLRLTESISIGASVLALGELKGGVAVQPRPDDGLESSVKSELVAAYAYSAGLLVRPAPWFNASLVLRSSSYARFVYPMEVNLGDDFPLPIPPLHIEGLAQYEPASMNVECAFKVHRSWLVAASLTWKAWSEFPNVIEYTASHPDTPAQPLPDFRDILVSRLGMEGEFQVASLRLRPRLGLSFEPTPAPVATGFHSYLDNDRWVPSMGLEVRYSSVTLSIAGQWHHLVPRKATKRESPTVTLEHSGSILFGVVELGVAL